MATYDPWRKAPSDPVERFEAAVAGIEGLETRAMAGPAERDLVIQSAPR